MGLKRKIAVISALFLTLATPNILLLADWAFGTCC